MASCATCGSTILFGATKVGALSFCHAGCQAKGHLLVRAAQVPEAEAYAWARRIHAGRCPACAGPGPIDNHRSYRVWSAFIVTQWHSRSHIVCRSCGVKAQLGDIAYSAVLGWWGFPWGLVMTPVQIVRTLAGLAAPPKGSEPSAALIQASKLELGAQAAASAPA